MLKKGKQLYGHIAIALIQEISYLFIKETRWLGQLILILLSETVSSGEEVPAALLVHLPHVGFLKQRVEEHQKPSFSQQPKL